MTDKYGPWIGWNGGPPPVEGNTTVEVATRLGVLTFDSPLGWSDTINPIIAYRIKLEPEVRRWQFM